MGEEVALFWCQFNWRFGNGTCVRQIATFHSRNRPTFCISPCLSRVSRYSNRLRRVLQRTAMVGCRLAYSGGVQIQ